MTKYYHAKLAHSHGEVESDRKTQKVRCFNCQELGTHLSWNCPKPKVLRCMPCGQTGHARIMSELPHGRSSWQGVRPEGNGWLTVKLASVSACRLTGGSKH
ncbi:uncharacterized protein [Periplaneta americana]|uniref:uncharacterized protein n=1 Tax=Periplaneta americana TaxID=6978 RepID=UPI0037E97970